MSQFREAVLLRMRYELEQLITEREGMIAANQERASKGHAQAYTEDAFKVLANTIGSLLPDPHGFSS
jgi:hypothetical protein